MLNNHMCTQQKAQTFFSKNILEKKMDKAQLD